MTSWMLYATVVGLFAAAAAWAAESVVRIAGARVRWIWAAALLFTLLLAISAGWRRSVPANAPAVTQLVRIADFPLRQAADAMGRFTAASLDPYAAVIAAGSSAAILLLLLAVVWRFARASAAWPQAVVQHVPVRIAPRVGPAVIGVLRPEIVVPRWLLTRNDRDLRTILVHESEHVRARDPLLLGLAWGAAVVMPWNPAVWYMLSRLRLAVELDCDARVLGRGAEPLSYGSLLLEVAQHAEPFRLATLALSDRTFHLHRRIVAMSPIRPKFARLRGIAGGAFAGACLLVACETSVPTVPAPEQGPASRIAMQPPSRQALPETLRVAAKRPVIARMPIRGQSGVRLVDITPSATDPELFTLSLADSTAPGLPARDVPLFILDGERITDATLHGLSPMRIGTVEVLKGRMAALLYGDEGKNGVVLITTRPRGN